MEKAKKKCNPLWHYVAKNLWRYLIAAVTMGISILLDIWFPLITMESWIMLLSVEIWEC